MCVDCVDVCVIFLANCILWLVDAPEEGNGFFFRWVVVCCIEYFCGDRVFVSAADIIRKILSSAVGNCGDWQRKVKCMIYQWNILMSPVWNANWGGLSALDTLSSCCCPRRWHVPAWCSPLLISRVNCRRDFTAFQCFLHNIDRLHTCFRAPSLPQTVLYHARLQDFAL